MAATTDKEEEAEALKIQKKLASKVQEEDYQDDFEDSFENVEKGRLIKTLTSETMMQDEPEEILEHDLSNISMNDRKQLVDQLYPDVVAMTGQFEDTWQDIQEMLAHGHSNSLKLSKEGSLLTNN